ncbi:MAG: hypothetical protein P8M78_16295 [Myxococcota bacterium]|nr:hypothetical protein [Myxococcota bacterium]
MNSDDERFPRLRTSVPSPEVDAELSALLDGELEDEAAADLRSRMLQEPALAERFADLGAADGSLRQWGEKLPAPDRLVALRAKLQTRIDAEPAASADELASPAQPAGRVLHLPVRWRVPAAAALAAGLALFMLSSPRREVAPGPSVTPSGSLALEVDPPVYSHEPTMIETPPRPVTALEEVADAEELLVLAPSVTGPIAPAEGEASLAATRVEEAPEPGPDQQSFPSSALGDADEMELAVALEYEMLADLDVIENLDLLERLSILDGPEML